MNWKSMTLGGLVLMSTGVAQATDGDLDAGYGTLLGRSAYAIASRDPAETPGVPFWAQTAPFKILPQPDGSAVIFANIAKPWDIPLTASFVPGSFRITPSGEMDFSWGGGTGFSMIYVGEDFDWRGNDAVSLPDGGFAVVGTIYNPDGSSDMAVWKVAADGTTALDFGVNGLTRLERGGLPSDEGKAIALIDVDTEGFGVTHSELFIAGNIRDGNAGPHQLGMVLVDPNEGFICPSAGGAVCGNVVGGFGDGHSGEWRMLRVNNGLCPNNADIDVADLTGFRAGFSTAIPVVIRGCGDTGVVLHTAIGNVGGTWTWFINGGYANQGRSLISTLPITQINAIVHAPTSGALGNESMVVTGFDAFADGSFPFALVARITRDDIAVATFSMGTTPGVRADTVLVQPGGKILLGGGFAEADWNNGDAFLMRLNADLSPDPAFGSYSGALPGRMAYTYSAGGLGFDNRTTNMALTADGKLLMAGYVQVTSDNQSKYGSVMRVLLEDDRIFANGADGL